MSWNMLGKLRSTSNDDHEYILKVLRMAWSSSPGRLEKVRNSGNWCECCGESQRRQKDLEVHHISPIGSLSDYDSIEEYVDALYYSPVEVLCKTCHKNKH